MPARYETVRDAKDWLNPYLQVCAGAVDVTVHAIKPLGNRGTMTKVSAELATETRTAAARV